ncbi:hypothetical protein FGM00_00795 [Aggregatimonas sangjinii]|uniref:Uncharacterized protein n=1 Tax=Aggregatimonas sangjinii TaxID=2583587 RepID=A0A5B7SNY4_9FLAO|nr:hypothetical protein [Aggregatimonas sangjinii]QCW98729.1 hypothetical protein FGM00_00795 [Aggregatimonas sangjinii]
MTLEEMQHVWSEMTEKIDEQKRLTDTLIINMKQEKFRNKISRIARYESLGAVICFLAALAIIVNIGKLDTWYLLASGIVVIAYLVLIPWIVLKKIAQMKRIDMVENNYRQSLIEFTKKRKQFLFWQRTAIFLNFFLLVLILPVSSKLLKGKDLFVEQSSVWGWYILVMLVLVIPFSFWGYRKYSRMTGAAEKLLRDLQS